MANQFGVVQSAPASAKQDTLAWRRARRERMERRRVGMRNIGCALRDALELAKAS